MEVGDCSGPQPLMHSQFPGTFLKSFQGSLSSAPPPLPPALLTAPWRRCSSPWIQNHFTLKYKQLAVAHGCPSHGSLQSYREKLVL